ncbi:sugar phosphate isomerase/epimerase [Cryptosporangium sp. NPDC051539]|uniref:sugar phosphate isomerase/epimerase n=1 Tax=Cryptosporangium sp. NPDC051539 TaxID=3363962 RepID=UPI00379120D5
MTTLSVFQSLWAMEDLPWRSPVPWTLPERVERIAAAGFAGLAVDLGAREAPAATDLAPLLGHLRSAVFCFLKNDADLDAALRYADTIGAELVVGCGQVFPGEVSAAAGVVGGWLERAGNAGVAFQLETHRYTVTNDLGFTVALLEALPGLTLAADLSHYVVGNELPDSPDDRVDALLGRVLERAGSLQGRIATRGQVQVSPAFGQHRAAADRFRAWWAAGMRAFAGDDLMFCCELGTVPYAITGPDGEQISDRWADALLLKSWAEELFERRHQ